MRVVKKKLKTCPSLCILQGFHWMRIVRILWGLEYNTRPFLKKRKEVTNLLDKMSKDELQGLRLIELLEQGDEVLRNWALDKGALSLTDMV